MTNEELAVAIQQGQTELMGQLWEQVERFVYKKANEAMGDLGAKPVPRPKSEPELEPEYKVGPKSWSKWSKSWRGIETEDLVQCGYIALNTAVKYYDPEKGAFITLFSRCLDTAFTRSGGYPAFKRNPQFESDPWGDHQKWEPHDLLFSKEIDILYTPLKSSDPDGGVLADVVPYVREDGGDDLTDLEDAIYNDQLHKALDNAIDTLPDEQAAAIRGRYWDDLQYSELAERCGVSSEQARLHVRAGILSLRSPKLSRELSQFIEENTDYYRGAGLYSFRNTGASSVERAAVQRENREEQWRRWRMEAAAKP